MVWPCPVFRSGHYLPVATILRHLDAMSAVKANVLHWHLVDSASFPYVSTAFPELAEHGAYRPTLVYTPEDVRAVVRFAKQRVQGLRHHYGPCPT